MIVKRCIVAVIAAALGAPLAACGTNESGFSAYVADHWPRWAGGMPDDVPPRPGAPGYDEFVAHGQANQTPPGPGVDGKSAATAPVKPVFQKTGQASIQPKPQTQPPPQQPPEAVETGAPADDAPSENTSVVKGGLY